MQHRRLSIDDLLLQFCRSIVAIALISSSLLPALDASADSSIEVAEFLPIESINKLGDDQESTSRFLTDSQGTIEPISPIASSDDARLASSDPLAPQTKPPLVEYSVAAESVSDTHDLHCTYLGGGDPNSNLCSNPDGDTLHESFVVNGGGYNGYAPSQKVQVLCEDPAWGCTQVPVYYMLQCSVSWTSVYPRTVNLGGAVKNGTGIGAYVHENKDVGCGHGTAGSCEMSFYGTFPGIKSIQITKSIHKPMHRWVCGAR